MPVLRSLRDVAAILETTPCLSADAGAREVSGFSIDSRTIQPAQVFAAIRGERHDGHHFVLQALARGATGALVDSETPLGCTCHPLPHDVTPPFDAPRGGGALASDTARMLRERLLTVPSVPEALQRLARAHRASLNATCVAITGSSGKTTTKDVIATVLGESRRVSASRGNLNSQIGMPLAVLGGLGPEHEVGVFEVGMSARGEITRLCSVLVPQLGVVTNVGPAHLEFLGSLDEVFRAKSELIEALPPGGWLFLNAEDAYCEHMAQLFAGRVIRVSQRDGDADYVASDLTSDLAGCGGTIRIRSTGERIRFQMPIPGLHMGYAALFAVAVAGALSIDPARAARALSACRAAPHRMEVRRVGDVTVLDDAYNANPASSRATLVFAAHQRVPGRRIVVLGDMLELGGHAPDAHASLIGEALESGIERLIFVGPLYAAAGAATGAAHAGQGANPSSRAAFVATAREALYLIEGTLEPGDLLVLKGSRGIGLEAILAGLTGEATAH